MPKHKNNKYRVAQEGPTIDGRHISRTQIQQMADNYDPVNKHGARIWMEHGRSIFHDGYFPAYGDVLSLSAKEVNGKLGLYAELDPTEKLKEINKSRQKVFTSIEMHPDYLGTGEAYMSGLAVTDSPSSSGTEMLVFNIQNNDSFKTDSLFSEAIECSLDFSEEDEDSKGLFAKVTALFSKKNRNDAQRFNDIDQAVLQVAEQTSDIKDSFSKLKTAHDKLTTDLNALKISLDKEETPPPPARPLAEGHNIQMGDENAADC